MNTEFVKGMMFGRRLAVKYTEFFRKYVPGCAEIELLTLRRSWECASRRIVGEFELTIEDFKSARQLPDQVAVFNRPTDVHPTDTSEKEFRRFLMPFQRYQGPWIDPRAIRRLYDGTGISHRRRAVDPDHPAGL